MSSAEPSCLMASHCRMLKRKKIPRFYLHHKRSRHRAFSRLTLSVVPVWKIVAYEGQGLPGCGAIDSALRVWSVSCTGCRPKHVGCPLEDNDTRGIAHQRVNCGTDSAALAYRRSSSNAGFVSLVTPEDGQKVEWSRTYFCPHRLARGEGELQSNWKRRRLRSRQTNEYFWPTF